jgi:hypothetical protein
MGGGGKHHKKRLKAGIQNAKSKIQNVGIPSGLLILLTPKATCILLFAFCSLNCYCVAVWQT